MNKYRNKFEADTGKYLKAKKVKFEYETEKLEYTITANYIPDFILVTKGGRKIYVETKGNGRSFDGPSRRKLIAVKRDHPDKEIKLVFYTDGVIGPTRKDGTRMRQSDWAIKYGFDYSIKTIPEKWLE